MSFVGRYINLDRSTARRASVERQLDAFGISARYSRFPAIDGALTVGYPHVEDRAALGCFLSHVEALKCGATEGQWLHILEDDAVISRHIDQAFSILTGEPQYQRMDVVFTNVMTPMRPRVIPFWRKLFDGNVEMTPSGKVTGLKVLSVIPLDNIEFGLTTSYLINPRSISKVVDLLERRLNSPPFVPVDYAFQHMAMSGELSVGCTMPFLTAPTLMGDSTIRDGLDPWRAAHMAMEWALFLDRDSQDLDGLLADLRRTGSPSRTAEIIAGAYDFLLRSL